MSGGAFLPAVLSCYFGGSLAASMFIIPSCNNLFRSPISTFLEMVYKDS